MFAEALCEFGWLLSDGADDWLLSTGEGKDRRGMFGRETLDEMTSHGLRMNRARFLQRVASKPVMATCDPSCNVFDRVSRLRSCIRVS
jgi:hypothetical protein